MLEFRKARPEDVQGIMKVVHEAQAFMATLGIDQWQDGYPSEEIIRKDIELGQAYVFADGNDVASITILTAEPEPIYDGLDGEWHTGAPYLTMHRMAIGDAYRHSGLAARILDQALLLAASLELCGIRADTHRGNKAMRRFLEKSGFAECGLVSYPGVEGDPIRVAYDRGI